MVKRRMNIKITRHHVAAACERPRILRTGENAGSRDPQACGSEGKLVPPVWRATRLPANLSNVRSLWPGRAPVGITTEKHPCAQELHTTAAFSIAGDWEAAKCPDVRGAGRPGRPHTAGSVKQRESDRVTREGFRKCC